MEGEEDQQQQHHHHHLDEKRSVLKKVKAKAKKIKDTITKHGHGHNNHHDYEEEEENDDEEMAVDPEIHGDPSKDSSAAESYIPRQDRDPRQNAGGDDGTNVSYHRRFGPGDEESMSKPMSGYGAGQGEVRAQLRDDLVIPTHLKEDPHAPKDRGQAPEPENYHSKVADPTGSDGEQMEVGSILQSFDKMRIGEESVETSKPSAGKDESSVTGTKGQNLCTGSHDQFSPEPLISAKMSPGFADKPPGNHPQQGSYTEKIASATSLLADKVGKAKNLVTTKLGYGSDDKVAASEGQETSKTGSVIEYGKKVAVTVEEKVVEAGSAVMAKVQGSSGGENEGGARGWNKGVSVKGYLAEKLRPADEDKMLSEVMVGAWKKRRDQEGNKLVEEDKRDEVKARVAESEDAMAGEGSCGSRSSSASPRKNVMDKLKSVVTSLFGRAGETHPSQAFHDNLQGNGGVPSTVAGNTGQSGGAVGEPGLRGNGYFQGALPPNHKLLLKSVNLPASRLARHLPIHLYGHVQHMTSGAVKHYTQPKGCQYGRENSGQIYISLPHAHCKCWDGQVLEVDEESELMPNDNDFQRCWFRGIVLKLLWKQMKIQYDEKGDQDGSCREQTCRSTSAAAFYVVEADVRSSHEACAEYQIVTWFIIPATRNPQTDHNNNALALIVLLQYVPRLYQIFPLNSQIV
ncbi:hypothetical protein Nepgr_031413 [Nepenthes gracilis]|uniref:Uncharacterized protein n=1 Tax=Nepenthes gracilis TaxID=150966 RepID=A0AAD3TGM8_NEPGR|nr:hypothetical protein Nepgr_031413 [Nepenthes gracilis]